MLVWEKLPKDASDCRNLIRRNSKYMLSNSWSPSRTPTPKRRYSSSIDNLKVQFEGVKLSQIDAAGIEEFKQKRLHSGVRSATVNRDLAVLRRMLKLALRRRFITRTPFEEVEFLEERKARRRPHILTFGEELRLLAVAPPLLRALIVLLVETGLRVGKEALPLKWKNVDLDEGAIFVCQSKTLAGQRMVPLTERCKTELLKWQEMAGPGFSEYVFFNPRNPATHLLKLPKTWATALKKAAIEYFPIANLRHTFATRMHEARTSSLTLAGLLGHSSPGIVQTYAKVLDESRRDAIRKLEEYRQSRMADVANSLISNRRVN